MCNILIFSSGILYCKYCCIRNIINCIICSLPAFLPALRKLLEALCKLVTYLFYNFATVISHVPPNILLEHDCLSNPMPCVLCLHHSPKTLCNYSIQLSYLYAFLLLPSVGPGKGAHHFH